MAGRLCFSTHGFLPSLLLVLFSLISRCPRGGGGSIQPTPVAVNDPAQTSPLSNEQTPKNTPGLAPPANLPMDPQELPESAPKPTAKKCPFIPGVYLIGCTYQPGQACEVHCGYDKKKRVDSIVCGPQGRWDKKTFAEICEGNSICIDPKQQTVCADGKKCYWPWQRCNGRADCFDATDETACKEHEIKDVHKRCEHFEQQECANKRQCYWPFERCDGKEHCEDKSDEHNCPNLHIHGSTCEIQRYKRCDGIKDCLRGEDEQNCADAHAKTLLFPLIFFAVLFLAAISLILVGRRYGWRHSCLCCSAYDGTPCCGSPCCRKRSRRSRGSRHGQVHHPSRAGDRRTGRHAYYNSAMATVALEGVPNPPLAVGTSPPHHATGHEPAMGPSPPPPPYSLTDPTPSMTSLHTPGSSGANLSQLGATNGLPASASQEPLGPKPEQRAGDLGLLVVASPSLAGVSAALASQLQAPSPHQGAHTPASQQGTTNIPPHHPPPYSAVDLHRTPSGRSAHLARSAPATEGAHNDLIGHRRSLSQETAPVLRSSGRSAARISATSTPPGQTGLSPTSPGNQHARCLQQEGLPAGHRGSGHSRVSVKTASSVGQVQQGTAGIKPCLGPGAAAKHRRSLSQESPAVAAALRSSGERNRAAVKGPPQSKQQTEPQPRHKLGRLGRSVSHDKPTVASSVGALTSSGTRLANGPQGPPGERRGSDLTPAAAVLASFQNELNSQDAWQPVRFYAEGPFSLAPHRSRSHESLAASAAPLPPTQLAPVVTGSSTRNALEAVQNVHSPTRHLAMAAGGRHRSSSECEVVPQAGAQQSRDAGKESPRQKHLRRL